LFKGSLWFIGISFIGYIFFKIGILDKLPEKLQKLNDVYIVMGIFGLVGFIIGIKREMSGKYHAYGGPRRPSRPPQ
ncbi:MAG: hypothetical protein LBP29_08600, partial [Treponema sp.]|nr:hypothetical protein [Treponema sp.]